MFNTHQDWSMFTMQCFRVLCKIKGVFKIGRRKMKIF